VLDTARAQPNNSAKGGRSLPLATRFSLAAVIFFHLNHSSGRCYGATACAVIRIFTWLEWLEHSGNYVYHLL